MSRRGYELLGDLDEILGDGGGYEETVGAPMLPATRAGGLYGRPYALPGTGPAVASRGYSKGRSLVLPLSSNGTVAASATATITTRPQTLFRPERLVVQDSSGNFTINDLKIGKNSQFVAAGSLPSAVFAANAFGVRLKMDTCQVAMDVAINVTNNDGGAAHSFTAALIGPSVE